MKYLRETGWMTLYRSDAAFEAMKPQLEFGAQIGVAAQPLDTEGALALEPSLAPVFRHALMWPDVASLSNPLMVTRAYAARFSALGGVVLKGDARSLHRADGQLARRHRRGAGRCRERRGGARAVVAGRARAARHQGAARDQARLSPPLRSEGQRVAVAADHRHRIRLCDHPDGAGDPADHRRRIRRAAMRRRRRCSSTG